jgi:hypothetical protein
MLVHQRVPEGEQQKQLLPHPRAINLPSPAAQMERSRRSITMAAVIRGLEMKMGHLHL